MPFDGYARSPPIEDRFIIVPEPCFLRWGSAARIIRIIENTFVSNWAFTAASLNYKLGPRRMKTMMNSLGFFDCTHVRIARIVDNDFYGTKSSECIRHINIHLILRPREVKL